MEIQRPVRFEDQELDAVRMTVRTNTATPQAGDCVEVEVGGRWTIEDGRPTRSGGIWVPCEVLADTDRELVVKIA